MPRPRKELDMDMVKDMYINRNMSYTQIGKVFGVSDVLVGNRLKAAGIKGRTGAFMPEDADAVIQRYLDGESLTDVGMHYGVSQTTIRDFLKRHGVPTRSLSEAITLRHQKEKAAVAKVKEREDRIESSVITPELAEKVKSLRTRWNLTIDQIAETLTLKKVDVAAVLQEAELLSI